MEKEWNYNEKKKLNRYIVHLQYKQSHKKQTETETEKEETGREFGVSEGVCKLVKTFPFDSAASACTLYIVHCTVL